MSKWAMAWVAVTVWVATGAAQVMKVPGGYFEGAIQPLVTANQYMGAVRLTRGDVVLLNKGFGAAHLQPPVANSPTTRFPIGSLTKQFTAAAMLLLEERGRLALTDPLSRHLPGIPKSWDGVTLVQLLTHTSGLPNATATGSGQAAVTTAAGIVAAAAQRPLDFTPGAKFNYSNTGYIVLGQVIERLSGETYSNFVRANLFVPLGMTDSGSVDDAGARAQLASGYLAGPSGPVPSTDAAFDAFAAGALYSTIEDLGRWQSGLFGGTLLTPASLAKMTTPFKNDYALGIEARLRNGKRAFEHSGGYGAFRNMMAYYPDDRVSVIVLANMGSAAADIADRLGALAHGQMKTPATIAVSPPAAVVPAEVLAKYAGTYLNRGDEIVVSLENGKLRLQTAAGKFALAADTITRFSATAGDARVEFVVDANGAATALVLRQGGMMIKAPRK